MPWVGTIISLKLKVPKTFWGVTGYDFPADKTRHVVYQANNSDEIWELYAGADDQWHSTNLTKDSGADLSQLGVTSYLDGSDNNQHAVYLLKTSDPHQAGQIKEIYWRSDEKNRNDLLTASSGNPHRAVTLPTGYGFGGQHIFYLDSDKHIWHLQRQLEGGWTAEDISFVFGLPAADSSPHAFEITSPGSLNLVYRTPAGDVVAARRAASNWFPFNLTEKYGLPKAAGNPVGIGTGIDNQQLIHFQDTNGNLMQYFWNGVFGETDVPAVSVISGTDGSPPMLGGTIVNSYFMQSDGTFHVIYHGTDGHLHELFTNFLFKWSARDMMVGNMSEEPLTLSKAAFIYSQDYTQRVVYAGKSGSIIELRWVPDRRHPFPVSEPTGVEPTQLRV